MNAASPKQQQFSATIRNWVAATKQLVDADVRAIEIALFSGVIQSTPVDTGRARGNWQTTVGGPASGVLATLDPTGTQAIQSVVQNVGGAGKVTWLTNNLPYIEVLEYGEYPNPPKRGTRVRGGRKATLGASTAVLSGNINLRQAKALTLRVREPATYEIRTVGGYSKQAPAGMVRINMARIDVLVAGVLASGGGFSSGGSS